MGVGRYGESLMLSARDICGDLLGLYTVLCPLLFKNTNLTPRKGTKTRS